ncbi:MAG: FtsQ-type POTRA domain-containing protein [Agromyces sp.]
MKRPDLHAAPGPKPEPVVPAAERPAPAPRVKAKAARVKAKAARVRTERTVDPARRARQDIRAARKRRAAELRAERRRFTAERRRRRRVVVVGAALLGVLFVGVFGVAYSPLMAVKSIIVTGTSLLDAGQVQAALAGELGTPLPLVNQDRITSALSAFPAVQSFSTESVPPSTLIVRIVERTPIGVLKRAGGYDLVDIAGVVVAHSDAPIDGAPRLDIDALGSDAFRALGTVMLTLPLELRSRAVRAGAKSTSNVWFDLADGPTVTWGDASNGALKLRVLEALLAANPGVNEINVSAPNSPFTR